MMLQLQSLAHMYGLTLEESLTTEGQDKDRTTGGTFTQQWGYVYLRRPLLLTNVYWDLRTGTFTLYVDNVDRGNVVLGGDTADADFGLGDGIWLVDGRHVFRVVRSGASTWFDKNAGTYTGTEWYTTSIYYNTTNYPLYTIPIKMRGYFSDWGRVQ